MKYEKISDKLYATKNTTFLISQRFTDDKWFIVDMRDRNTPLPILVPGGEKTKIFPNLKAAKDFLQHKYFDKASK